MEPNYYKENGGIINKLGGHLQIVEGDLFYSPNCNRVLTHRPVLNTDGFERDIFLPKFERGYQRRIFDIDTSIYEHPLPWSTAMGWMSFFPLRPSFDGPIFEQLLIPRPHQYMIDEESKRISIPQKIAKRWLDIEQDILNAIHIIRMHYNIPFIFPPDVWTMGYLKTHRTEAGLQRCMEKSKAWFKIWMGLFSFVIAQANAIRNAFKDKPSLAKKDWRDLLIENGAQIEWLEGIEASTICSFGQSTMRAGCFLTFPPKFQTQPTPEWFCEYKIPIWYIWDKIMSSNPKYAFLAPPSDQFQSLPSDIYRSPLPAPLHKSTWKEFFERREKHTRERIASETDHQKQQRLARMKDPPTKTAKIFEWVRDEFGYLYRIGTSVKMREDVLNSYAPHEIIYDALRNEYDCCQEFGSRDVEVSMNEEHEGDLDNCIDERSRDEVMGMLGFSSFKSYEMIDECFYTDPNLQIKKQRKIDAFVSEVLYIFRIYYGYTQSNPVKSPKQSNLKDIESKKRFVRGLGIRWISVPIEAFEKAEIQAAADFFHRLQGNEPISPHEWDISPENRESLCFSHRLSRVKTITKELFMFDFGRDSTVDWHLTVKTAAHVLVICRLDERFRECQLAEFLLTNGIPFNTLKKASLVTTSPVSTHPNPVLLRRPAMHKFSMHDYQAYRDQCHVILKQPRGRAALMAGAYLWRIAMTDVSFDSILEGPTGWSTNPDEMLVVRLDDNSEEYIDDKLTEMEVKLLQGEYICSTGKLQL